MSVAGVTPNSNGTWNMVHSCPVGESRELRSPALDHRAEPLRPTDRLPRASEMQSAIRRRRLKSTVARNTACELNFAVTVSRTAASRLYLRSPVRTCSEERFYSELHRPSRCDCVVFGPRPKLKPTIRSLINLPTPNTQEPSAAFTASLSPSICTLRYTAVVSRLLWPSSL